LQPSDKPTDDQIRAAVLEALKDDGIAKCAAHVAQEFGEHPEIAVRRMNWAIDCIERSYPDAA
jgi:UDP:flavonoid glycosyltransferase YjiC (YdhE family)